MGIVRAAAAGAGARVPAPVGPGQGLHRRDGSVRQLPDEAVDAHVQPRAVPVVSVLVPAQLGHERGVVPVPALHGLDVPPQGGIVRPGGVYHHPLGLDAALYPEAVVVSQNTLDQLHCPFTPLCSFRSDWVPK